MRYVTARNEEVNAAEMRRLMSAMVSKKPAKPVVYGGVEMNGAMRRMAVALVEHGYTINNARRLINSVSICVSRPPEKGPNPTLYINFHGEVFIPKFLGH
jgi:hypothetical protein